MTPEDYKNAESEESLHQHRTVEGVYEREESIEAQARKERRIERRERMRQVFLEETALQTPQGGRVTAGLSSRTIGRIRTQMAKKAVARGSLRWAVTIAATICFWQFIFAALSLMGYVMHGMLLDFDQTWYGKIYNYTIGMFLDLKKIIPVEMIGHVFWGMAFVIGGGGFLVFILYFYLIGIQIFRTPMSMLILFTCAAFTIFPVTNLFPWLLIWVLYLNMISFTSMASSKPFEHLSMPLLSGPQEKILSTPTMSALSPGERWLRDRYEGAHRTYVANNARRYGRDYTRQKNTASKLATRNTFESLYRGDLQISKLAKDTHTIVVHSIPLEGWALKNTSMNNAEHTISDLSSHDKIRIIREENPDVSASVITTGPVSESDRSSTLAKEEKRLFTQKTMYPFGLIVDGHAIASYPEDSNTITSGDSRYKKHSHTATLQKNPVSAYIDAAHNSSDEWNEVIVHKPKIKGILIDAERLRTQNISEDEGDAGWDPYGDQVTEYYDPQESESIQKKYADKIIATGQGVPKTGPRAGMETLVIKRKRTGIEKALEYAETHYPELPVYVRKKEGIYTLDEQKVDAPAIYGA